MRWMSFILTLVGLTASVTDAAVLFLAGAEDGSASIDLTPGESKDINVWLLIDPIDDGFASAQVWLDDDDNEADGVIDLSAVSPGLSGPDVVYDRSTFEANLPDVDLSFNADIEYALVMERQDGINWPPDALYLLDTLTVTHTGDETVGIIPVTFEEDSNPALDRPPAIHSVDPLILYIWNEGLAGIVPNHLDPGVGGSDDPFIINLVTPCVADANRDGTVDPLDMGFVLARYGCLYPDAGIDCLQADVNRDGEVDPLDTGFVLARFGPCPNQCSAGADDCADSDPDGCVLRIGESLVFESDNTDATMTCDALGLPEMWHSFTLDTGGEGAADVTVSLCGTDPPFANAFFVIDDSCPCDGDFVAAGSFDQETCDDGNWAVHYDGLWDGVYWTPVLRYESSVGPYTWTITAELGGPPLNDDCADAVEVFAGLTDFSTLEATTDGPDLPPECDEGFGLSMSDDIWFHYEALCTGTVTVSTCNDGDPGTGEANYDTRLAAYEGTDCPPDSIVGCNDDGPGCAGLTSIMHFEATTGTLYTIRLGAFGNTQGVGTLFVECQGG